MELGGYSTGPPDPDGLAETLVEELSVSQPGLGHSLFVLEGAELTGEHCDENHQVGGKSGSVQLSEGVKELAEPRDLIPDLSLHQRQQLLEAEGGGRGSGPGQGLGLAGVQVDNREDDAHHHVGLKNVRKIILF